MVNDGVNCDVACVLYDLGSLLLWPFSSPALLRLAAAFLQYLQIPDDPQENYTAWAELALEKLPDHVQTLDSIRKDVVRTMPAINWFSMPADETTALTRAIWAVAGDGIPGGKDKVAGEDDRSPSVAASTSPTRERGNSLASTSTSPSDAADFPDFPEPTDVLDTAPPIASSPTPPPAPSEPSVASPPTPPLTTSIPPPSPSSPPPSSPLTNRHRLAEPLYIHAILNPGIQYVQGSNALCAVVCYVFRDDPARAFCVFQALVAPLRDLYTLQLDGPRPYGADSAVRPDESTVPTDAGMTAIVSHVQNLLRFIDPQLAKSLTRKKILLGPLLMKWLTTLFAQDLLLPDTLQIWRAILPFYAAQDPDDALFLHAGLPRMLDLAVALLLVLRPKLVDLFQNFDACMSRLQAFPVVDSQDVDRMVRIADEIRARRLEWHRSRRSSAQQQLSGPSSPLRSSPQEDSAPSVGTLFGATLSRARTILAPANRSASESSQSTLRGTSGASGRSERTEPAADFASRSASNPAPSSATSWQDMKARMQARRASALPASLSDSAALFQKTTSNLGAQAIRLWSGDSDSYTARAPRARPAAPTADAFPAPAEEHLARPGPRPFLIEEYRKSPALAAPHRARTGAATPPQRHETRPSINALWNTRASVSPEIQAAQAQQAHAGVQNRSPISDFVRMRQQSAQQVPSPPLYQPQAQYQHPQYLPQSPPLPQSQYQAAVDVTRIPRHSSSGSGVAGVPSGVSANAPGVSSMASAPPTARAPLPTPPHLSTAMSTESVSATSTTSNDSFQTSRDFEDSPEQQQRQPSSNIYPLQTSVTADSRDPEKTPIAPSFESFPSERSVGAGGRFDGVLDAGERRDESRTSTRAWETPRNSVQLTDDVRSLHSPQDSIHSARSTYSSRSTHSAHSSLDISTLDLNGTLNGRERSALAGPASAGAYASPAHIPSPHTRSPRRNNTLPTSPEKSLPELPYSSSTLSIETSNAPNLGVSSELVSPGGTSLKRRAGLKSRRSAKGPESDTSSFRHSYSSSRRSSASSEQQNFSRRSSLVQTQPNVADWESDAAEILNAYAE